MEKSPYRKEIKEKEIKVSTTDKESSYMFRDGKPEGFFYLDHRITASTGPSDKDIWFQCGRCRIRRGLLNHSLM